MAYKTVGGWELEEGAHCLAYETDRFYRFAVDYLWLNASQGCRVTESVAAQVVSAANLAAEEAGEPAAFGRGDMERVVRALRGLSSPAVVRGPVFRRRHFCPVPTFLWAVDLLYRLGGTPYGVRLFLTEERIERVCKACVLEPSGLENVLVLARRAHDYERGGFFGYGTAGGWGRWVLLGESGGALSRGAG